jgi:hypothetical protein
MLSRIALALVALAFGPPSITVTPVTGPTNAPVPGALFVIASEHHHEAHAVTAHARLESLTSGRRHTLPLRLTVVPGKEDRWALTKQWPDAQPAVLVLSIHQGEQGKYGIAEAIVRIGADGRVLGIEKMLQRNDRGDRYPGPATPKDVDAALAAVARGT